jgi:hypothetical protein
MRLYFDVMPTVGNFGHLKETVSKLHLRIHGQPSETHIGIAGCTNSAIWPACS